MMIEKTYEISWAYGETSFINARDEEHAKRIASTMGFACGLGRVISVTPLPIGSGTLSTSTLGSTKVFASNTYGPARWPWRSRPYYIAMIELGMEVEDMRGYLGVVAASPRGGKWLILKDDGRTVRRAEHEVREYEPSLDRSPAYEKWLEKRELR